MPRHVLPHKWTHYTRDWVRIEGKPVCLVKTNETPQGYIWQHGKQYGVEPTLEHALEYAEAAREFYPRII